MRAALYTRVSTEDQEREGTSLNSQLEACLKKAQELGYMTGEDLIIQEVCSGLTLDRPGLNRLRQWASDKQVDAVIAYTLDRLSRDPVHFIVIQEEFERADIGLILVTETIDSSDMGKLISYIKGYAAKLEAEKIRERTTRGKRARALSGRLPSGTGRGLYGYFYLKGKGETRGIRIVNEDEAKWVRAMYRWLVEEGLSINAITVRLRAFGVPTPSGSQFWIRQTVYRILNNPAYIGKTYAYCRSYVEPKRRSKGGSKRKLTGVVWRPKEEWIEIPNATPAVISNELFEGARKQLQRNKDLAIRNRKREYLLSGYVFCRRCGRRYEGYVKKWKGNGKRYEQRYYRCARSQRIVTPVPCSNRHCHAQRLEDIVWAEVEALISQPELVLAEIERRKQEASQAIFLERDLAAIETELQHLKKRDEKLFRGWLWGQDEAFIEREKLQLNKEREALGASKLQLERRIEQSKQFEVDVEAIQKACELIKSNMQTISYTERRFILETLQIRVLLDGDQVSIEGAIPKTDSCFVNQSTRLPRRRWRRQPP